MFENWVVGLEFFYVFYYLISAPDRYFCQDKGTIWNEKRQFYEK